MYLRVSCKLVRVDDQTTVNAIDSMRREEVDGGKLAELVADVGIGAEAMHFRLIRLCKTLRAIKII